jgi:hypothetical protein
LSDTAHTFSGDFSRNLRFHLYENKAAIATICFVQVQDRVPCCATAGKRVKNKRVWFSSYLLNEALYKSWRFRKREHLSA